MKIKKTYNITNIPCNHIRSITNMVFENGINTGVIERKGEDIFLSFDILEVCYND